MFYFDEYQIDRVDCQIGKEEFNRNYVLNRIPVILTNCLTFADANKLNLLGFDILNSITILPSKSMKMKLKSWTHANVPQEDTNFDKTKIKRSFVKTSNILVNKRMESSFLLIVSYESKQNK